MRNFETAAGAPSTGGRDAGSTDTVSLPAPSGTVTHRWTPASGRELMTHVHVPASGTARAVVVLLDGLARDAVLAFRSYRMLAEQLADDGVLAVRFAWSGTADSGLPEPEDDRPAPERWLEDLDAVVQLARATAPGAPLALVAVRASAPLATTYAEQRGGLLDQVVLWEPVGSGRAWLRSQDILHRMSHEFRARETYPPLPEGSVEVPGRLFLARDAVALRALRVSAPEGVRLDIVQRPFAVVDPTLARVLAAATSVTELDGQAETLDAPTLLARVSPETVACLAGLVRTGDPVPVHRPVARARAVVARVPYRGRLADVVEEITSIDGMHAVVTHAAGTAGRALVAIPGSGEPMDGPTGLWTRLAREAAARDVTTLRMDRRGAGELGARTDLVDPWPYRRSAVDDFTHAFEWFRDRTGLRPVLTGMCSGSWLATQVALRSNPEHVVCVNQIAWDLHAAEDGNVVPEVADLALVVATPDAQELAPGNAHDLRTRLRRVAKSRTPAVVWRHLGRRGVVQMPEPLFDAVTARGTAVHQIVSSADLAYVNGQQMRSTMRRLTRRGRTITLLRRPELDHALLSAASRDRAVADILALVNRVAPHPAVPDA